MTRATKREVERALERFEQETGVDAAAVRALWIRSIRRETGDVDDPLSEAEFNALWNRTMRAYGAGKGE